MPFSWQPISTARVSAELWDLAFTDFFTRAYGLAEPSRRIILDPNVIEAGVQNPANAEGARNEGG